MPAGFCHSFISARHCPSTCVIQSFNQGQRKGFHSMNVLQPDSCLNVSWCWTDHPHHPKDERLTYFTKILTLFLCFAAHGTELNLFMCIVLFPMGHLQSSNKSLHWDLRLCLYCTVKLKQVWKTVFSPEIERQHGHYTQYQTCISASHLVPLCHQDYFVGIIFSAKDA